MSRRALSAAGVAPAPFPAAPAIVAGEWLFLGGTMATDWESGVEAASSGPADFAYDRHDMDRQTHGIYRQVQALFEAGGTTLDNMVRIDQFTPYHDQFRNYLPARDQYLTHDRPASTALAIKDLLVPGVTMQLDGIAVVPTGGRVKEAIDASDAPMPRAGYSLAIRYGDWLWCAGASPTDFVTRSAYPGALGHTQPDEIQIDPNFWYGSEIEKQAAYDLHKLDLYLRAADSSLERIVKANVYLTDSRDLPGLWNVWRQTFGDNPPATTVVPIDQMGMTGSRVEINCIALRNGSDIPVQVIETDRAPRPHFHAPQALKVGPYLFLSGRHAVDDHGIAARARAHAASPFIVAAGREELATMLDDAAAICEAAGGSIADMVRVQLFATDLREVASALGPWSDAFAADPPTFTVVGVTGPHIVPGLTLATDMTAYIPD
jgi:enamine deaminase RidA (YjgF/YER057c/UK114 family)